jgi:micrococcal nuclease
MVNEPAYQYSAKLVKIIDGDTLDLNVDLGLHTFRTIRCRLYNINAPERFTAEGKAAIAFLTSLMPIGAKMIILTYKDPTDKYGRWIADAYIDRYSISMAMVANGHAVERVY